MKRRNKKPHGCEAVGQTERDVRCVSSFHGAWGGIRTRDLRNMSPPNWPLFYPGVVSLLIWKSPPSSRESFNAPLSSEMNS